MKIAFFALMLCATVAYTHSFPAGNNQQHEEVFDPTEAPPVEEEESRSWLSATWDGLTKYAGKAKEQAGILYQKARSKIGEERIASWNEKKHRLSESATESFQNIKAKAASYWNGEAGAER